MNKVSQMTFPFVCNMFEKGLGLSLWSEAVVLALSLGVAKTSYRCLEVDLNKYIKLISSTLTWLSCGTLALFAPHFSTLAPIVTEKHALIRVWNKNLDYLLLHWNPLQITHIVELSLEDFFSWLHALANE